MSPCQQEGYLKYQSINSTQKRKQIAAAIRYPPRRSNRPSLSTSKFCNQACEETIYQCWPSNERQIPLRVTCLSKTCMNSQSLKSSVQRPKYLLTQATSSLPWIGNRLQRCSQCSVVLHLQHQNLKHCPKHHLVLDPCRNVHVQIHQLEHHNPQADK